MDLHGWKYEGRKISDELHAQFLGIIEILNNPELVDNRTWGGSLQKYIGSILGVAPGQVRTIKRMMEEFDILKKGALNSKEVPSATTIYTTNGKTLVELLEAEKLMLQQDCKENLEQINEIKDIYRLYYQKVMMNYTLIKSNDDILHPLKATLKALKKFDYLDYWEWYILNTIITSDNDVEQEKNLDMLIYRYRNGEITTKDLDIKSNKLSHSYVLGNFVYSGLVRTEGKKEQLKIFINEPESDIINKLLEG